MPTEAKFIMTPSDFENAKIVSIFFSFENKMWVVVTDKGTFSIDKLQNFEGTK